MALARYFDKAALSISSLLRGADHDWVRGRLSGQVVKVCYDGTAASSQEGRWTLELLISLLARLYPSIAVEPIADADPALAERLWDRARVINRLIDRAHGVPATHTVVVGETAVLDVDRVLYAGSSGWAMKTSSAGPVGCGTTDVPYGAGAAACVAAAWVFRQVFGDLLPDSPQQQSADPDALTLSLLDFTADTSGDPMPTDIDVRDAFLVGVGAIGNAAVWALARTPKLSGRLYLVDGERVDPSNVQRYVLTDEDDEDASKPEIGRREWSRASGAVRGLDVISLPFHWPEYMVRRGHYLVDRALLALDSAEARIAVQASLPRWIANSWTQPENLGISRHEFLGNAPCVACLYLPKAQRPNRDQLVAAAIRAEGQAEIMEVRRLLHTGVPMGEEFVSRVAERFGIECSALLLYASQSLDAFYVGAVCGGVLLRLGADTGSPAEVPMAFQSAFAGILLAAELVADAGQLRRTPLPARTEFDLLRAPALLGLRPHLPERKDGTGRCICRDPVFRSVYASKYLSVTSADTIQEPAGSETASHAGEN